jgi:hypothetical protein
MTTPIKKSVQQNIISSINFSENLGKDQNALLPSVSSLIQLLKQELKSTYMNANQFFF